MSQFKGNLFFVDECVPSQTGAKAKIRFNAEHPVYKGHFPGNPVTPGVILIQLIKELMEIHTQQPRSLKTVSRCKFLSVLEPVSAGVVEIDLETGQEGGEWKVNATAKNSQSVFFKISARYQ